MRARSACGSRNVAGSTIASADDRNRICERHCAALVGLVIERAILGEAKSELNGLSERRTKMCYPNEQRDQTGQASNVGAWMMEQDCSGCCDEVAACAER